MFKRIAAVAGAVGLLVAACGGDDQESEATTATTVAASAEATTGSTGDGSATTAPATGDTGETVNIAFLPLVQANPYIAATLQGIEATAEAQNATVQVFDANFDASRQYSQCQDAITSGAYQAFIVVPVDQSISACLEEAIAAGIQVVNTDFPIGPDPASGDPQIEGQAGTVLDPPALRGEWIFTLIEQGCEGNDDCEVALITGALADPYSAAVNDVVTEKAKASGNIDVVAVREGGYLADPTFAVVQDILQASPGLDVIATTSDPMTSGAEEAVKGAGLTDQVKLIGGGASAESFTAVPEGRWIGTFLSLPFDEGRIGAEIAIAAVRGTGETGVGYSAVEESGLPAVVTKDNVAEVLDGGFKAQW